MQNKVAVIGVSKIERNRFMNKNSLSQYKEFEEETSMTKLPLLKYIPKLIIIRLLLCMV